LSALKPDRPIGGVPAPGDARVRHGLRLAV